MLGSQFAQNIIVPSPWDYSLSELAALRLKGSMYARMTASFSGRLAPGMMPSKQEAGVSGKGKRRE